MSIIFGSFAAYMSLGLLLCFLAHRFTPSPADDPVDYMMNAWMWPIAIPIMLCLSYGRSWTFKSLYSPIDRYRNRVRGI
tara:strand:+ start:9057 stop:9293 length:237 start_codon:yes stop_codon:yes gene_type:complete